MTDIKKRIEDFLNYQNDFEISGIKLNYPPIWFLIVLGLIGLFLVLLTRK